jgi:ribosomal protein S12 methylthiotransferase
MKEVEGLVSAGTKEIVLISQDLASWGLDRRASGLEGALDVLDGPAPDLQPLVHLTRAVAEVAEWTRLLYLYPSGLTENLIQAVLDTGVPYFDLSLQHASPALLRRMRRWGNAEKFLDRIAAIRAAEPTATFRSSFIVGYPGETEADHDALLEFLEAADLDWVGFFSFSSEEGTYAADLGEHVAPELMSERLKEASERQDAITEAKREAKLGSVVKVLVDDIGEARSTGEAPEIDGIIEVPEALEVGNFYDVRITQTLGTDLVAEVVGHGS